MPQVSLLRPGIPCTQFFIHRSPKFDWVFHPHRAFVIAVRMGATECYHSNDTMSEPIFKLSRVSNAPVTDEELIADLRRVAKITGTNTVTNADYKAHGSYGGRTVALRFKNWNDALTCAGLVISNRINIPDEDLFENILILWQRNGRQPRISEADSPPSSISAATYKRRFGSWMKALKAFVDYANGTGVEIAERESQIDVDSRHKTSRDPSLRLRWRVLQRDNFKCCGCGSSPAITLGVELHVDHIDPWSKGGETVLENLQTLCSSCNLGKSNLLPS